MKVGVLRASGNAKLDGGAFVNTGPVVKKGLSINRIGRLPENAVWGD
jgi:hypothetical protein